MIDDEEDITTYMQLVLEDHGYAVVTTNDARRALALLEEASPDVVLLDLLMPRVTGASLYSRICNSPRLGGTPIVVMSALDLRDELPRLLATDHARVEPAGFVEKPVDAQRVLEILAGIVGRTEAHPR